MRIRSFRAASAIFATALTALVTGCMAGNPTIAADKALVAQDQAAVTSATTRVAAEQKIIATVATQPAATQPAPTDPAITLMSQLNQQLAEFKSEQSAAMAKQSADLAKQISNSQAVVSQQVQAATQTAAAVTAAVPSPWAPLANIAIMAAGGIVMSLIHKQSLQQSLQSGLTAGEQAAQTQQAMSANHTSAITTAITALAGSVPASVAPAVKVVSGPVAQEIEQIVAGSASKN